MRDARKAGTAQARIAVSRRQATIPTSTSGSKGACPIKDGANQSSCGGSAGQAGEQADENWAKAVEKDDAKDLGSSRAERNADSDLGDALGDQVGENSIEPDTGQQKGEPGEGEHKSRTKALTGCVLSRASGRL